MKILISHSWKDKSLATRLKYEIEQDGYEVWFDVEDMLEGDPIQDTIDQYLEQCDVMVLVWSENVLRSKGVEAEIRTALKCNKRIIPFLTDETPLSNDDPGRDVALLNCKGLLDGLLGVPALQFDIGVFILRRALLMLLVPEAYQKTAWFSKAYGNAKELGGYLKYIQSYRLPNELNNDGHKEFWVNLLEKLEKENEEIRRHIMPKNNEDLAYMQNMMAALENGNNSKEQLEVWLKWCRQNENAQSDILQKLAAFIEKDIERLQSGGSPVKLLDMQLVEKAVRKLQSVTDKEKNTAISQIEKAMNGSLLFLLNSFLSQKSASAIWSYISKSPIVLRQLSDASGKSEYVAVKESLILLADYLVNKKVYADDTLSSYFDNAWLIVKTAKMLIDANLIPADAISLDFLSTHITDKYFSMIMTNEAKKNAEKVLEEIRNLIGIKKKEINWGKVAAGVIGGMLLMDGLVVFGEEGTGLMGGGDIGNASSANASDSWGNTFEDKTAEFMARFKGGEF